MDFLLLSVLSVTIVYVLLCFPIIILTYRSKPSNVKLPPGELGLPLLGETLDFVLSSRSGHPDKFILDRMKNYSPEVFKTSFIGEKIAVFCGPSGNKFVFSNENDLFKTWLPRSIQKILFSEMKSTIEPEDATKIRNVFSEFLKPEALKNYLHVMDYTARQHLADEWAPNRTLKVQLLAKKFTCLASCRLFLGIEDPTHIAKFADQFELVISGLVSFPIDIPGTAYHAAIKAAKVMHGEIRKIIRQHKLNLSGKDLNTMNSTPNFLSRIFNATDNDGKFTSEEEIASIVLGFLIASQDTTASLIRNLLYYLADNPHVYAEVLREQNEVAKLKESKSFLTWEDTHRMKYSRNVMHEVLRLATSTQGFFREATRDINYANYIIPKGWKVYWSVNSTHKDPKYFPNPEKFDPTRFEGDGPAPYTFTPFGGGRKMCPGHEYARQLVLVFLHNLVRNYSWEKLIPNEKIKFDHVQAVPANGLPIKIQPHRDRAAE